MSFMTNIKIRVFLLKKNFIIKKLHLMFLTKLFSSIILLTEKAIEIVTDKGKPSGTAITIIIIPNIKDLIISFKVS